MRETEERDMVNALRPQHMSPAERLDEAAAILAAGLRRLADRKSSALSADCGDSSLDLPVDQRVPVPVRNRRRGGPTR